ncbi:MAG: toxin-antitoxin system HicB family antitoxin [Deltaproteobacteria bacterium]|nr:MAG: toxin-antitoxin system HicB family antitoxin [Deltaproteobacteria bacterium]
MKYKGYRARIEFDDADHIFVGRIAAINDVVSFHGSSVEELEEAFREAVDDYLAACMELGQKPNRPVSGKLLLRLPEDLHAAIAERAELKGISINSWVVNAIEHAAAR